MQAFGAERKKGSCLLRPIYAGEAKGPEHVGSGPPVVGGEQAVPVRRISGCHKPLLQGVRSHVMGDGHQARETEADECTAASSKQPETDRPVCEVCGALAIGIQSLGCCATVVCFEHAEQALRDARPGETIVWESCAFHRFEHAT